MVPKAQLSENKLKEQRERRIKWKADRAAKRDRDNNNDDDDSLEMSMFQLLIVRKNYKVIMHSINHHIGIHQQQKE